jgi:carbonic anhydrase/acetyltransferase-like protein (isoleucine patch superfamily)
LVGGEAFVGRATFVGGEAFVGRAAFVGGEAFVGRAAFVGGEAFVGRAALVGGLTGTMSLAPTVKSLTEDRGTSFTLTGAGILFIFSNSEKGAKSSRMTTSERWKRTE